MASSTSLPAPKGPAIGGAKELAALTEFLVPYQAGEGAVQDARAEAGAD